MNKPYFTKYIPDPNGKMVNLDKPEEKLKLFLCSRDIVLGDTWYNEGLRDYPKGEVANTNTEVMNAHMCMMGDQDQYESFKIIGEVSPQAIWVKEGMEFESDQLVWNYMDEAGDVDDRIDWNSLLPEDIRELYTVGFKCPTCNTYH